MARGNLAYDETKYGYEYNTALQPKRSSNIRIKPVRNTTPEETVKVATKAKKKTQSKKINTALVMLVAVAFMVLCRGVAITEKTDLLEKRKGDLDKIIAANQKTQIEIDSALNLKNVEQIATNELNMARPEKYQTVYIKVEQKDMVEKTEGNENSNPVTGFFSSLKAYLD